MSIKIKLKHSAVNGKAPQPSDLDNGELALNTNAASPAAYIKDSAGNIVKLAGAGAIGSPDASETVKGIAEIATKAEVTAGTDDARIITPLKLKQAVDALPPGTTVSATAPATPEDGQAWFDSTNTVLKVWDGTAWQTSTPVVWSRTGTILSPTNAGDVVNISAGTAALPGLTPVGDVDSGLFSPGPDQVAISTNGTGRLFVDASGRVGVGTATPEAKFEVAGSAALRTDADVRLTLGSTGSIGSNNSNFIRGSNDQVIYNAATSSGRHSWEFAGNEKARLDATGNLLVGTSSSRGVATGLGAKEQIETSGYAGLSMVQNSNDSGGVALNIGKSRGTAAGATTIVQNGDSIGTIFFAGADGTDLETAAASILAAVDGPPGADDMPGRIVLSTTAAGASTPTERMRIKSAGGVDVNADYSPGSNVDIMTWGRAGFGVAAAVRYRDTTTSMEFYSPTGHPVAFTTSSDYRLKTNIAKLQDACKRIKDLNVYSFDFVHNPSVFVDGFIAHEVQTVVPEAVTGTKDAVDAEGKPVYQGIDQSKLVPLLTAALQEAVAKIETLETKVAALEGGAN